MAYYYDTEDNPLLAFDRALGWSIMSHGSFQQRMTPGYVTRRIGFEKFRGLTADMINNVRAEDIKMWVGHTKWITRESEYEKLKADFRARMHREILPDHPT